MIRMDTGAFLKLQGDISDVAFARKLGVSRSQLWRIRTEKCAVGGDFIEKFMLCFPEESVNDYFYAVSDAEAAREVADGTKHRNFFAKGVPEAARSEADKTQEEMIPHV